MPQPPLSADPVRWQARRGPEHLALETPDTRANYAALDRMVTRTARRLHEAHGVTAGMRVALRLPRGRDFLVTLLALLRRQAVVVPISTRLPPAAVAERVKHVGAVRLVTGDPDVQKAVGKPALEAAAITPPTASDAPDEAEAPRPPIEQEADRPATILFTSGSTGAPKAALHTWASHVYSARGSAANIALAPGDRWLLALPPYHVGGLAILVRCVLAGATVVVPSPDTPLGTALRRHEATHVSMVATQLRRVLQDDDTPPPSLRAALLGGSALPASLTDWAHERGWSIHTSYGMTEMASQVATTPPGASAQTLRTSGRVLPHRTCTIAPDGEILVRGPTLLEGYVTKEGRNDPRDADGWYHTGDVGRIDSDGLLHVEGRQDRMFVSGGENIQPEAIERVLTRHDDVLQAAVVPVPDETYGQRPVAFVRSRARSEEDRVPEALQEVLRDSLAAELPRFMVPDAFYPWPAEHRRRAPSDSPGDTSGEGAEPNPDGVQDQLKVDRERLKEEARRRRADETD